MLLVQIYKPVIVRRESEKGLLGHFNRTKRRVPFRTNNGSHGGHKMRIAVSSDVTHYNSHYWTGVMGF